MQIVYNQSPIDNEIIKILKKTKLRHTVVVVLFKGKRLPKYCLPMPLNPELKINISIGNNFSKLYFTVLKKILQLKMERY